MDRGELVQSILQYHDWSETLEQGTEPPTAPWAPHCWLPTAPGVCALGWVKCRAQISLLVIFCIIVYVMNKFFLNFELKSNSGKAEPWVLKCGEESVMLWGMFSAAVFGSLIQSHSRVNANIYQNLLQQHAVCSLHASPNQPAIFMQDRAPSHCKTDKAVPWS